MCRTSRVVLCRDIYTPISNLLFHHYGRQKGKSVFADHDNAKWWATVSCCWPPTCKCMIDLAMRQSRLPRPQLALEHVQVQQTHIKAKYLLGLTDERPGPALAANMTRYGMGQVLVLDDTCCTRLHVAKLCIWTALPFRLPALCMHYVHSGCTLL